jgi:hypothetical protein
MFLTKGELAKKCGNSYLYFKRILERKQDWFVNDFNKMSRNLNSIVFAYENVCFILEKIENQIIPNNLNNVNIDKNVKTSIEKSLVLITKMEFNFFKMLDKDPNFKSLKNTNKLSLKGK